MPGFEIEGIGGGGSMEAITTTIDCQFLLSEQAKIEVVY